MAQASSTARKNGGNSLWEEHKNIIMVVAAGLGLLLAIIIFCICRCVCRKKKRQQNNYDKAQGGGDPRYYNLQNPPQWGNGGGDGGWNQSSPMPPPNGSGGGGWNQSSQIPSSPNGNGGGGGWGQSSQMPPPPNGSGAGGGWGQSSQMPPPPNGSGGGGGWSQSSQMSPPNGGGGGNGWGSSPGMPPPNGYGNGSGWGSSPGMPPTSGGGPTYNGDVSQNFSGIYQQPLPPPPPGIPIGCNKNNFTYEEMSIATGGFSQANMIGQGGFGYVHKGVLSNGKEVAIKSLKPGSGQGEREFQAEVDIIRRVHHRHLVSLVGFCVTGEQRMLVYDFVPNNTLDYHLHGKNVPVMDFPSRLRIALGAAKGLAYLHEDCHPKIIHRDIKSANILLDNNFEAMVADFGMARLSADNHTHVSTRVMGTFGYMAPEYVSSGKLTDKSDVFSYGIMILELITGKQPVDNTLNGTFVDWARPLLTSVLEKGNIEVLVDPRLEGNYDRNEMLRMIACASACVRHAAKQRPKMSQIMRALEGNATLDNLTEEVKPTNSSLQPSGASSDSLNAL